MKDEETNKNETTENQESDCVGKMDSDKFCCAEKGLWIDL